MGTTAGRNSGDARGTISSEVRLIRQLAISPAARRDMVAISNYLTERSEQASLGFELETEAGLREILANPRSCRIVKETPRGASHLRSGWVSSRFENYLAYYREFERSVRIVRVMHGARNVRAILRLRP